MLEKLKLLLGISISDTSKDTLLGELLEIAIEHAINITHNEEIEDLCPKTIIQMAKTLYNKLGTEGLQTESYSGVNFNYLTDYSVEILNSLKAYRKVRVINV